MNLQALIFWRQENPRSLGFPAWSLTARGTLWDSSRPGQPARAGRKHPT